MSKEVDHTKSPANPYPSSVAPDMSIEIEQTKK